MFVVRAARWPEDEAQVGQVDSTFSTDRVYAVVHEGLSVRLCEEKVVPPVVKAYSLPSLSGSDRLFVAEEGDEILGLAEVELAAWNRRATIMWLRVSPLHRGRGVGAALVQALVERARQDEARCLWAETQNVNYPAVQFYGRMGFRWCGFDESLYDPVTLPGEVALFFSRELES